MFNGSVHFRILAKVVDEARVQRYLILHLLFFRMQVVHFLELHSRLLGLKRLQPLSVLEAALFEGAAKSTALSEVGAALVSLLVDDIYNER
jgi:hypothetical protein